MFKKRRKCTFRVQRVSDTHFEAKSTLDFESPFRVKKKLYRFAMSDTSVLDDASSHGLHVEMPPDFILQAPERPSPADVELHDSLYEHQKTGVRQAISFGRCLIADEMGVGKSAQGASLAKHFGGRVCVVCPSYLTNSWLDTMSEWYPELDIGVVKKTVPDSSVIVSYSLTFRRDLGKFNVLLLDESHYVKNKDAKCTKAIRSMARKTPYVFLMSGTPAPNAPVELYTQMSILRPMCTYTNFVHRYCAAKQSPLGFVDVSGSSNKEELAWYLSRRMMVRRLKRDVLHHLPPKTRTTIQVDVPCKGMAKKFKRWKEINQMMMEQETHALVFERKALVSELFLMTAESKLNVLKSIVKDLPPRTLIFVYHKNVGDACQAALDFNCIRIDGSTSMEDRHSQVKAFQDGEYDYAVLSMMAAGTGITLTRANNVFFAELYYVPGVLVQCEDRAHRIGQVEPVSITYLIANGSLDAHMYTKVKRKLSTLDKCIDNRSDREF